MCMRDGCLTRMQVKAEGGELQVQVAFEFCTVIQMGYQSSSACAGFIRSSYFAVWFTVSLAVDVYNA